MLAVIRGCMARQRSTPTPTPTVPLYGCLAIHTQFSGCLSGEHLSFAATDKPSHAHWQIVCLVFSFFLSLSVPFCSPFFSLLYGCRCEIINLNWIYEPISHLPPGSWLLLLAWQAAAWLEGGVGMAAHRSKSKVKNLQMELVKLKYRIHA